LGKTKNGWATLVRPAPLELFSGGCEVSRVVSRGERLELVSCRTPDGTNKLAWQLEGLPVRLPVGAKDGFRSARGNHRMSKTGILEDRPVD
jgi:hypothetical protein